MTQLLQAQGWYGVFLLAVPAPEPDPDDERLRTKADIFVRLRPLIGWTSAEGGFRGLYYNEMDRRLSTSHPLAAGSHLAETHLGDIWESATPLVYKLLTWAVLEHASHARRLLEGQFSLVLTESARILFEDRKIPLPEER